MLEEIAKKIEKMSLGEKEEFLLSIGRRQHINFETGESSRLIQENPERFIKVGSKTTDRTEYETEEEYIKACISNAAYLYEKFPLIFEFYDELMNGIIQKENLESKGKNK